MTWLEIIIAFASGIAVGMAIGWEQGYHAGKKAKVSPDDFYKYTRE